jgi:anaerobic ribonucleoside-triphosphate reductase
LCIITCEEINRDEILKKLESKRTKCIVYTRVMGYHRPVESFNIGKKGEHKERKQFVEDRCKIVA